MGINMASSKKKKRIYNPVTGKYYELRQRTTKSGRAGQIKGLWHPPKKKKKKSLWDIIFG
ncbi:MAG: hypothetical protein PWQ79_68 [Thermococcaceae archaeon]|nr:hypothetical protein [Thermococcaceae archaeon]MDK2913153.1 hypothetical protein [Thermococcaceae archaeon]